jgi:hypothetical protein
MILRSVDAISGSELVLSVVGTQDWTLRRGAAFLACPLSTWAPDRHRHQASSGTDRIGGSASVPAGARNHSF